MKMNLSGSKLGSFTAVLMATLVSDAHAVNSINVQTFNPSTSDHFVLLEDGFNADFPRNASYFFGANYNYATDPLPIIFNNTNIGNVIDSIQTFDLMFGFKASKRFGLFVGLPIHFVSYPSTPVFAGLPTGSASGLGDLKLMAKIRITDDNNNTSIALIPEFHLPTGNTANFMSDASTVIGLRGALERQFEAWTLAVNLGFMAASNARYDLSNGTGGLASIDYRKRINLGVGGFLPFTEQWGMNLEYNSNFPIPFSDTLNPNELYAGVRYQPDPEWVWTFGGSIGKIGGPSGLGMRIVAGLRFTLYEEAKAAPRPIYTPAPTPFPTPMPAAVIPAPKPIVVYHSTHVEVLREVTFEHASANLTQDGKAILDQVARVLDENKKHFTKIMVDGHTNRLGSDAYNMKLSRDRARSVRNYLTSRGVPANALESRGFGYRKPKLPYSDKRAMEVNRRVEFLVIR